MKYTPHEYQQFCIDYLLAHPAAGLFLKPGMGKTSVALTVAGKREVGPPPPSADQQGPGDRTTAAGGPGPERRRLLHQPGERGVAGEVLRPEMAL